MSGSEDNVPIRIQGNIIDALSRLTCVRRIVSFGAIARGCYDQWSDVDLLVICEHAESISWVSASVIREIMPVLFYREFTTKDQPSGRYWFREESAMNRLDISFESKQSYAAILVNPVKDGHDMVMRDEYIATCDMRLERDRSVAAPWKHVAISQEETEVGRCLYRAIEAVKFVLRGNRNWKWDRETCVRQLRVALQRSSGQEFGGGDLRGLAEKCFEMNEDAERRNPRRKAGG